MFYTFTDRDGQFIALNLTQVHWMVFDDETATVTAHFGGSAESFPMNASDYYTLKNLMSGRVSPAPMSAPLLDAGRA